MYVYIYLSILKNTYYQSNFQCILLYPCYKENVEALKLKVEELNAEIEEAQVRSIKATY